jgi:SSS family transporter
MRTFDWIVLGVSLAGIVLYGLYKGRGSNTVNSYLLAGKTMPWWAMALSIMATQASAITFISTTSQSYLDGMRFVQFYLGLPIAMVVLAATAVPIFHRTNVYTAYEYLEKRFDPKTRALVSGIFLIQRGLGVGFSLSAPAIVLTVLLGWPSHATIIIMGGLVTFYTVCGGIKAVTWTDVQQMLIMAAGLLAALLTAIWLLPSSVSLLDAVRLAGASGKLNAIDFSFDLSSQFNVWSGLIGGTFLMLAYFGTDQSQVQRYLTGKSIAQSRLSLLFNAMAKVPMQFVILFIGAMVFVFYVFERPPLIFDPVEAKRLEAHAQYQPIERGYQQAFEQRRTAAVEYLDARRQDDAMRAGRSLESYRQAQTRIDRARTAGAELSKKNGATTEDDTNFIFLSFVIRYMPVGVVGLVMAAIFAAAMSTSSAEINSLATVSVIDFYRRHVKKEANDHHYLWASRLFTLFWGVYAIVFAQYAINLGSLVVAVNQVGSLFYGAMLGVFALAFYFPRVRGTAAFVGVLAGEAAIFYARFATDLSFLWYNLIGCAVVILVGVCWPARRQPAVLQEDARM